MPRLKQISIALVTITIGVIIVLPQLSQNSVHLCANSELDSLHGVNQILLKDFHPTALNSIEIVSPSHRLNFEGITDIGQSEPNQTLLITTQNQIMMWDTNDNQLSTIGEFNGGSSVQMSSDGKKLLIFNDDHINLWNVKDNVVEYTKLYKELSTLALSNKATLFAFGTVMQTITLVDVQTSNHIWTINAHNLPLSLTFNKDDTLMAYGTHGDNDLLGDIIVGIVDINAPANTIIFTGHNGAITSLDFHPHSSLLASGSRDTQVKLWDFCTNKLVKTLEGHNDRITSLAFSPNGQFLAAVDSTGIIKFWEVSSGQEVAALTTDIIDIREILFDNHGSYVTARTDSNVYVWNFPS